MHYSRRKLSDLTFWRTGRAEIRARGTARLRTRRLHAGDARAVLEREFHAEGPAVAGPSALRADEHRGDVSPAYRRLFAHGGAGHDPGRYRLASSLLRPAGPQGDPLRRC